MSIKRNGGNGRRSLSVEHGGLIYTSGITSTNIEGDITEQATDVLNQIDNILQRAGSTKTDVISANITLSNMANYGAFNAVWDMWVIDGHEPVRQVTGGELALSEYKVKVSVIAEK